jgi:hypothetical protein
MIRIGTLESIWRYPVKSMRGESVNEVFVAYTGVMGDRVYALSSSDAAPEFPWHTNREQEGLVLYKARFKNRESTLKPAATEAALKELLNPPYPNDDIFAVEVGMPDGKTLEIEDPAFLKSLRGKSITIDPDTAETQPRLLKHIARKHDGFAGVYAAVLKEGVVKPGDELSLFD